MANEEKVTAIDQLRMHIHDDTTFEVPDLEDLLAEIERLSAIEQERGTADQALVDRYRDPKTGKFNFPRDVAAIVRRLDAAEQERDALREALAEAEPYVETLHSLMVKSDTGQQVMRVLKRMRTALNQTRTDASEAPE